MTIVASTESARVHTVDPSSQLSVDVATYLLNQLDSVDILRKTRTTTEGTPSYHYLNLYVDKDMVFTAEREIVTTNPAIAQALLLGKLVADASAPVHGQDAQVDVAQTLLRQGGFVVEALKEYNSSSTQHRQATGALLNVQSKTPADGEISEDHQKRAAALISEAAQRVDAWAAYVQQCAQRVSQETARFRAYLEENAAKVRDEVTQNHRAERGQARVAQAERALRSIPLPPGAAREPAVRTVAGKTDAHSF